MSAGRAKIQKLIVDALLWCALCVLLIVGFLNQGNIRRLSSVSLRYNTPISGQAAYAARQYSITRSDGSPYWPVFWNEHRASLTSEFKTASTDCISFSGDASTVWPAVYIIGATPGVTDSIGCVVSEALAWRLWGSFDVVGMPVKVDESERVIRGVFKGEDELALLPYRDEDTSQSWSAVDLVGGPADAVRADAENFAQAAGLGKPDYIIMNGSPSVAGALAALPLLILSCYGLAMIIVFIRKRFREARKPVFYICLILIAVALPAALRALPAWLIPTRWSDFSFWSSLADQALSGMKEFLRATPQLRDVELRVLLIKQAGLMLPAVCIGLAICFRWHIRVGQWLAPAAEQTTHCGGLTPAAEQTT